MDTNIKILVIALVAISIGIAPSLVINKSVDAATHYCTDYTGMSQNWINGCQQGWWDHNHCKSYNPDGESNAFSNGYKVGWSKGECKSTALLTVHWKVPELDKRMPTGLVGS